MADTTVERINIDIQVTSQSAEQRIKRLEMALDALKESSAEASEETTHAASSVGSSASHASNKVKALEKALHKVRNAVLSVPKTALSTAFNAAIAPVKSLERSISSVHTRISSTFAALKRIAIYRLMRTMIKELTQGLKEGIGNLYKWSEYVGTRFHSSMDSMATSALYIKNSLATIAEPILNVLAPAIEFLADRFAALAASIAEFLAALTGQDQYTIALRFPEKYGEEAEETAKAMQKWLGPFDEINRLSDPSKSGKDLDLDWTKMFETMTVEGTGPIGEFVKKLKEGFQAGDLTEIGQILGTKLQEAMDGINWPAIQEKARTIASSIGTFINGFFADTGFASSLGATIAEALNTAFSFLGTLAHTLDWAGLGVALGQGIQTFLDTFDFALALDTAVTWATGFVTFLANTIGTVDWKGFGEKVGEAIRNIDWEYAFGQVFNLGVTIINSLVDFISGVTTDGTLQQVFRGFGTALGDAIKNIDWKGVFTAVVGLGGALLEGLLGAISSFVSTVSGMDIDLWGLLFGGSQQGPGQQGGGGGGGDFLSWLTEFLEGPYGWDGDTSGDQQLFAWIDDQLGKLFGLKDLEAERLQIMTQQEETRRRENEALQTQLDDIHAIDLALDEGYKVSVRHYNVEGKTITRFRTIKGQAQSITSELGKTTAKAERLKDAYSRGAKGIGKSSDEIDRHVVATRKHLNQMEKGLDNFKKKATGKNPLGENKLAKAAKAVQNSAKSAYDKLTNVDKGISAIKKRNTGKNPLGENKFEKAANVIRNSAKAVGDALTNGLSTKATSATAKLQSKMTEAENAVGNFKNRSLTKLNQFAEGIDSGMGATMEDFAAESKGALDTMLRNYSFFASETARLMSDTSATYSGSGLLTYRSGGPGGGGGHTKPFTEYQQMANGGFLDNGEIFVAREAGPEMVGRFGNRNAVANNDQIVSGIAAGVAEANEDVVNAIYTSIGQVIGVIRENRGKNGAVNWDAVSRQISRVQKRQSAAAYM